MGWSFQAVCFSPCRTQSFGGVFNTMKSTQLDPLLCSLGPTDLTLRQLLMIDHESISSTEIFQAILGDDSNIMMKSMSMLAVGRLFLGSSHGPYLTYILSFIHDI